VVAKAGKPSARLMPLASKAAQRRPGRIKGQVDAGFFDPLPEECLRPWEDLRSPP